MALIILIVGILQAAVVGVVIFLRARAVNAGRESVYANVLAEVGEKRALWTRIQELSHEMADPQQLLLSAKAFTTARESLKAERGRVTIAQAELDMIEVRLRELEEITRELEASTTETKEELKILQRKEEDLKSKNDHLRIQIAETTSKMETIMSEIEMSAQMQEQVLKLRGDLLQSEEQGQTLLNEIQRGNEQYFILKRRYDALDVEYAQLYQQFNEGQH
jgi:chromosome segregation ATPase